MRRGICLADFGRGLKPLRFWALIVVVLLNSPLYASDGVDWQAIISEFQGVEPEDLEAHLLLAVAYANTGKLSLASGEFAIIGESKYEDFGKRIIAQNEERLRETPRDILALNLLAFTYYSFNRYHDSLRCFEELCRLEPKNVWVRHYLAIVHNELGEIDRSIEVLKEALRIDQRNEYTHLLLGLAYQKKGNHARAFLEFIQAPNAIREVLEYQNAAKGRKP